MADVARYTGYTVQWVEVYIMKKISEDVYLWKDYKPLEKCRSTTTFTRDEMSLVCSRFILYIWHNLEHQLPNEDEQSLIDKLHQEHSKTQIL